MSNLYSEDNLIEQTTIDLFADLWGEQNFINAFIVEGETKLERKNTGEVVLNKYLKEAIIKLNPLITENSINQVIDIFSSDKSTKTLIQANKEIYEMMKNGVKINVLKEDGSFESQNINIIDWQNPDNNNFLLVSQLRIAGELYQRRPDLIGFINGIPLILIELKAPNKNLFDAFNDNIRDYKDTVPQLFWYNAFIILSNGLENKIGSLTSGFEHFANWKKVESEDEETKTDLKTMINGTCEKTRLLDIVENFTLFDNSKGKLLKIVAKYHQYFGVNKAIEGVKNKEQNKGKLGVFWHTQGSGKSFSMMFFSNKVLRKIPGNWTFVVVTDRTELDKQIYKGFLESEIVKEKNIQAESVADLKKLLQEDHRFIFTLIHKFQFKDNNDVEMFGQNISTINNRNDIIVITDEAHRSQYGELSMNMRIALPNASFIGFTGTPLIDLEVEKTKEIFGDYVSVYNFSQSVEDGATVPIYYENRIPKLENINNDLQSDLEKIIDKYNLDDDESDKLENEFSTTYNILTREDRLESVATDIVQHFMNRGNTGKAMVVCIDKKTTVRMYYKVKKYFEQYKQSLEKKLNSFLLNTEKENIKKQIEFINNLDLAVVLSLGNNQNEIDDFKKVGIDFKPIRERLLKEDIETKFKDNDSNLRMVFVCSMWITGFDVPSITTLYLDKPMKNHTLMQTIARTNRVFGEKTNGLIVDYIGVFNNLRQALAIYASTTGNTSNDIVGDKKELIEELEKSISNLKDFMKSINLDLDYLYNLNEGYKILSLVEDFIDTIFEKEENKLSFKKLSSKVDNLYKAILPDTKAIEYQKLVKLINFLKEAMVMKGFNKSDITHIKEELSELLDKSIESEKFEIKERFNYKDLSKLPFDTLKDYFSKSKKHIEVENLKTAIEEKLEEMIRKNKTRKKFMDRLNNILSSYNEGSKNIDEVFNDLIELAKIITDEEKRAIREELTEEELSIFDLLYKDGLNPDEEKQVKKASHELLEKLKDKLVLDWRKYEPKRADVEVAIEDYLFYNLPRSYDGGLVKFKSHQVYLHVYENCNEFEKV